MYPTEIVVVEMYLRTQVKAHKRHFRINDQIRLKHSYLRYLIVIPNSMFSLR